MDDHRQLSGAGRRPCRAGAGFTLIELLLVVVIMLIAVGTAVPTFVQSYRGARLRTAVRHIVMAGRYTRGLAVLGQVEGALLLDRVRGTIEVVTLESDAAEAERQAFLGGGRLGGFRLRPEDPDVSDAAEPGEAASGVTLRLTRPFPEGIRLEGVVTEEDGREVDGLYWVRYYANGMCDAYEVLLADERDERVRIKVDAITGRAEVTYDL
ncbi:MAG: prepilin-type N-terminal cleavage/methylation domain-containing protein [Candidatus Marinimicrobia bacterium]|nr:prepilin-type N-terminal cleavage/methylation domain-containing protein [Candidatus Neomarinimicrobiota bacterium]